MRWYNLNQNHGRWRRIAISTVAGILLAGIAQPIRAGQQTEIASTPAIASLGALGTTTVWDLHHERSVSVEGTVTFVSHRRGLLVLQDGDHAVAFMCHADLSGLQPGQRVKLVSPSVYPDIPGMQDFPFEGARTEFSPSMRQRPTGQINYVERLQGYLTPPESGSYQFWLSSDDASELWLSPDDSREGAKRIASVPSWTDPGDWSRFRSQHSDPITLQKGRRYYIEALHDQSGGTDFLDVAWESRSIARTRIDSEYLTPYSGRVPSDLVATKPPAHGVLLQRWRQSVTSSLAALQPTSQHWSRFVVEFPTIVVVGSGTIPRPLQIRAGRPMRPQDNFRWSEVKAEVKTITASKGGLDIQLVDGDGSLLAHVQQWRGKNPVGYNGFVLRLQGICETAFDPEGDTVPGTLLIPTLDHLTIEAPSHSWDLLPPTAISVLPSLTSVDDQGVPIRIQGKVVAHPSPRTLVLQDEGSFHAYYSSDGSHWKPFGGEIDVPMQDSVVVGMAVSSFGPEPTIARFDHISGLRRPYVGTSVGSTHNSGQFQLKNGGLEISGTGYDIWDSDDNFYFVSNSTRGDCELIARLEPPTMHQRWAKAGLMIRASLSPGAPFVDLLNVGGNQLSIQWRKNSPYCTTEAHYIPGSRDAQWLKLARKYSTITVHTLQDTSVHEGDMLHVFGFLRRTPSGLEISHAFIRTPSKPAPDGNYTLDRPLLDIRSVLPNSRTAPPNHYLVRGVITCNQMINWTNYFSVQDQTAGAFIELNNESDQKLLKPGTYVEVYCDPIVSGNYTRPIATKVVPLGRGIMPRPVHYPEELSEPERGQGEWIDVRGIVYAAGQGDTAVLRTSGSYVTIHATGMNHERWEQLIDHAVHVQGVASYQQISNMTLLVPGPDFIEQVRDESFSGSPPRTAISQLSNTGDLNDPSHRIRIEGTVTFTHDRLSIIEDGTGSVRVLTSGRPGQLVSGDRVDAIGFPSVDSTGVPNLLYATLKRIGTGGRPAPVQADAAAALNGSIGLRLVTLEADVISGGKVENGMTFEMESQHQRFYVWCPSQTKALQNLSNGSRVRLTGIVFREPGSTDLVPAFFNVRDHASLFVVNSPADIVFIHGPPWLVLRHALYGLGILIGILVVVLAWARILQRRVRQRTQQLNEAMSKLQQETKLSATLSERQRLAGEIHDSLEQGMTGLMLQLDGALQSSVCPQDVRDTIKVAKNMVAFSHAEIRHAIWDLNSPALAGTDLGTALKRLADWINPNRIGMEVKVVGTPVKLPPETDHHVLRIVQEAVTNALKHAKATTITIVLNYRGEGVEITITDNGCGFSPKTLLVDEGHFGLRSLRRRAKKIDARLTIESTPGHGTVVAISLPVERQNPV